MEVFYEKSMCNPIDFVCTGYFGRLRRGSKHNTLCQSVGKPEGNSIGKPENEPVRNGESVSICIGVTISFCERISSGGINNRIE